MNKISTLVHKDFVLFLRDRKAMMLTYLLPIALISLFALAYGGIGGSKAGPVKLLISDQDSSAQSAKLVSMLDSIPEIIVNEQHPEKIKEEIMNGKALAGLQIPGGYGEKLLNGEDVELLLFTDKSREIQSGMLRGMITGPLMKEINTVGMKKRIMRNIEEEWPGMPEQTLAGIEKNIAEKFVSDSKGDKSPLVIEALSRKKGINWGLIQAVAGTAVMMLLFSAAGMGSALLSEKENGSLKRLMFSPLKSTEILSAHLIYSTIVASSQLIIMFVFARLVFGLEIGTQWPVLLLTILLTAITCSSFGIFLSAIARTRKQLESMSTVLILIMSGIGGSMVPLFLLPAFMQKIAVISVNYWAIDAFYDILGRSAGVLQLLPNIVAMLLISLLFTGFSMILFQKKLRQLAV